MFVLCASIPYFTADCAGTPNGSAVVDNCGVCDGDGTSCREYLCFLSIPILMQSDLLLCIFVFFFSILSFMQSECSSN